MCLGKVLWYYPSIYYTLHSFKPTHTPHMLCGPPQSFVVFFGLCVRFLLTNRIHEIDAVYSFQISRDIQQVYVTCINTRQYRKTFYFHIMLHEEILHEKENPNKIKGLRYYENIYYIPTSRYIVQIQFQYVSKVLLPYHSNVAYFAIIITIHHHHLYTIQGMNWNAVMLMLYLC